MRQHPPPPRLRSAYTLLEMLLALAVMAVLAGITIPAGLRMYADSKLTDAAEKVRALAGQGRLYAITTGERFQFRYEKEGRHFLLVPVDVPVATDSSTTTTTTALTPPRPKSTLGMLPEGLKFDTEGFAALDNLNTSTGPPLQPELLSEFPKATDLAGLSWSDAIVFAEDGSACDAAWLVVDSRKQAVPLEVRGLTGAATLGPMFPFKDR